MSIGSLPGPTFTGGVTRDFREGYPRGQRGRVPKLEDERHELNRYLVHLMKRVGCTDKCVQRNIHLLRLLSFQQLVQWSMCVIKWSDDQWKLFSEWAKAYNLRSSQEQRNPRMGVHFVQQDYDKARVDSRNYGLDPCNVYEPPPYTFVLPNGVPYTSGGEGYEPFYPPDDEEPNEPPEFPPEEPPAASGGHPGVGGGPEAQTFAWFINMPAGVTTGDFLPPFQVALFDRQGNSVEGIVGGNVTLTANLSIAGVLTAPLVDGVATFFGVQVLQSGGLTLAATLPYFTTAYSDSIPVAPPIQTLQITPFGLMGSPYLMSQVSVDSLGPYPPGYVATLPVELKNTALSGPSLTITALSIVNIPPPPGGPPGIGYTIPTPPALPLVLPPNTGQIITIRWDAAAGLGGPYPENYDGDLSVTSDTGGVPGTIVNSYYRNILQPPGWTP